MKQFKDIVLGDTLVRFSNNNQYTTDYKITKIERSSDPSSTLYSGNIRVWITSEGGSSDSEVLSSYSYFHQITRCNEILTLKENQTVLKSIYNIGFSNGRSDLQNNLRNLLNIE